MTILDIAKKLDANLVEPLTIVLRGFGSTKEEYRLVDLTLSDCFNRSVVIRRFGGRYVLDLVCLVLLPENVNEDKLVTKSLLRLVTEPYAGIIDPILALVNTVW